MVRPDSNLIQANLPPKLHVSCHLRIDHRFFKHSVPANVQRQVHLLRSGQVNESLRKPILTKVTRIDFVPEAVNSLQLKLGQYSCPQRIRSKIIA